MNELKEFWQDEEGAGTVEMVLLIAALVAVALLFRNRLIEFIQTALDNIFGSDTQEGTEVVVGN